VISIIIPTYNHLLNVCCNSIIKWTNLTDIEIIIVMNGCSSEKEEYVKSLIDQKYPVRTIQFKDAIGYTKAINVGIRIASGDYLVLLNDDTIILNDNWLDILKQPFLNDVDTGITGPVKFTWDCGSITRTAIAFWCCMFKKDLIQEIGYLNEDYNPGMGEDGEFSTKAELLGYKLVQVPIDTAKAFGEGLSDSSFPIYHEGSGTFADVKDSDTIKIRNISVLEKQLASRVEKIYEICCHHECDINKLFPVIRRYANRCDHITEFGVRGVFSTYAFLAATPKVMRSYDIVTSENIKEALDVAQETGIDYKFIEHDVLTTNIDETDLLFIDTLHAYRQLSKELTRHANRVRKYIILHDTTTWGIEDEIKEDIPVKQGLQLAIKEFLEVNPQWVIEREITESNGLVVLKRIPKFSIIVPTCDNTGDILMTCIDRILEHTNLIDKEVIVVANGCNEKVLNYLSTLRRKVTTLNLGPAQGQIVPVNKGTTIAQGEYIVLLDDDSHLLMQLKDIWIMKLYLPFISDDKVGVTGVFSAVYPYIGQAMHSGCAMYRHDIWKQVGGFDPIFGFGFLCDADVSLRIKALGYSIVPVGDDMAYPIYHPGSPVDTQVKKEKWELMRKNREILYSRHWRKPVYSVIVPTYNHLEDCLKPCLESIKQHTDFNTIDIEIIVVANGCKDGTKEYVDYLGYPFKLVWFDEGLGFTRATNEGLKIVKGDYIILFNNDAMLLEQGLPKNAWLNMLVEPFLTDDKVGITGPLKLYDNYAGYEVMIFFCVMIQKKLFDELGLLDECFSPGGGEDIDFCVKAQLAGYKQVVVPDSNVTMTWTNCGKFPIYHKGEGTFTNEEFPEYSLRIIKDNGFKNMMRYNKHIKLNLGSGGVDVPGYISVDKYDTRAQVLMDVFDMDMPENSVEEILASHLFEHVNPYKAVELLKKWRTILKPGGKLIMELPNIEELCKDFVTASKDERYGILNCFFCPVNTTASGTVGDITSPHLWGWYPEIMAEHLTWAGFQDIIFLPEQIPHPLKNFRVEAKKPNTREVCVAHFA